MSSLRVVTEMAAPVEVCFDLSRSIDLHLESMLASKERAVAGVTSGLIGGGEEVTWEARHFGVTWRMTSRIVEFDPPRRFVDEMVRGPFTTFRHEHLFEAHGAGTRVTDVITFRTPLGFLTDRPVGIYLRRLIRMRNATIGRRPRVLGVDRPATHGARVEPAATTRRRLVALTGLLGVLTVVHDVDHVRQGRWLPFVLYLVGLAALVSIATTLVVLVRYPTWSRAVAMLQGVATVVGVGAVHVAPQWSHLADSYAAANADALSWVIILAMMLSGLVLTIVAIQADY